MAENDQKHAVLFMQLIFTFQSAAWQQMGKVKNPITDKVEKDLAQARYSIDILEMLRAKTEGNLTEEEKRLLDGTISQLQLNYVDEFHKQEQEVSAEEKTEEAPAQAEAEKKEGDAKKTSPKKTTKKRSTASKGEKSKKTASKKK